MAYSEQRIRIVRGPVTTLQQLAELVAEAQKAGLGPEAEFIYQSGVGVIRQIDDTAPQEAP